MRKIAPALTPAQRRTLVERAGHWALEINALGRSSLEAPADLEKFHWLGVAFQHLHRCLELLERDAAEPILSLARRFQHDYESAKLHDFRTLLEHEEDYLIGLGWEPELVGGGERPWNSELGRVDWGITGKSTVETIGMFDRSFQVSAAIATAEVLIPELRSWWNSLA